MSLRARWSRSGADVRNVAVGDFVSAESHITCGVCFHCRTGQATCASSRRSSASTVTAPSPSTSSVPESVIWPRRTESSRQRSRRSRSRSATRSSPRASRTRGQGGGDARVRAVGLFSMAIARASGAGRVLATDRVAFRLDLARTMGVTEAVNIDDVADVPAGSSSRTRASRSTSSSRCPARRRRSRMRSGSPGTAATSSSSGSLPIRSSSTSRSRSSSRT